MERIREFYKTQKTELFFILTIFLKQVLFLIIHGSFAFMGVLGSFASALFCGAIAFLLKNKAKKFFIYFLNVVVTFVLIADLFYGRYFMGEVLSLNVAVTQAGMMSSIVDTFKMLFRWTDVIFIVDFLAIIIYKEVNRKKQKEEILQGKRNWRVISTLLIIFVVFSTIIVKSFPSSANGKKVKASEGIKESGILNYHVYDIYRFFSEQKTEEEDILSEKKKNNIREYLEKKDAEYDNIEEKKLTGIAKGKNLILIQVEAFQQNMIGLSIEGQEITPNINKFIKKSAYFKNFYSQTALGNTSDAEFMALNSFYPRTNGSVYLNYKENKYIAFPEMLKNKNYDTAAFHANEGSFYNRNSMYELFGFNNFYDREYFEWDEQVNNWGTGDISMFTQSIEKIEEMKKPFFSFLITVSSHYPFSDFEELESDIDVGELEGTLLGDYIKAMNYADKALGDMLQQLDEKGILDESLVAIYGDHWGIPLNQQEVENASVLGLKEDINVLWMDSVKVPFIVHFPNEEVTGEIESVGGQIDILPTLANLMGIDLDYYMGVDLFNEKREVIYRNDGYYTNGKITYIAEDNVYIDNVTGKKVKAKKKFKKEIKKVVKEVDLSDDVIKYDLLKEFDRK